MYMQINQPKRIENVSNKHLETNEHKFVNTGEIVEMQDPLVVWLI